MGSMSELVATEVDTADADIGEFFAPAATDVVDSLVGQYRAMRARIEQVAELVTGDTAAAIGYFLDGNARDSRSSIFVERLFELKGAIGALNSAYWSKAIHLTDVLNLMPQKRREEWNKSILEHTCPDFEQQTVRDTLAGLLAQRHQFLAERVDGIFRGLSGEHVTNSPAAFGNRMIVGYVLNEYHHENSSRCGLINDLRCVIARFMGRDEPSYNASAGLIRSLKGRWGEWTPVDGGALKIRLYRKGTAHIEVHPDMAWRLNSILAHLYPAAIPAEFRRRPARKAKSVPLMQKPLSFAVIELLAAMRQAYRMEKTDSFAQPYRKVWLPMSLEFEQYALDRAGKHARAEAEAVLESLGAVKTDKGQFQFDYEPGDVLNEVVASGCIPDQRAHQFYQTMPALAERAVELADIGPDDECLEPSAGTGGLADHMPKERTQCVEVAKLRCDVLKAKGHRVEHADFMDFQRGRYDRIVMNPPFDQGRWRAHVEHAAELLAPGGRLVAILPASARGTDVLAGLTLEWHGPLHDQFPGTGVSVVILVAEVPA